MASMAADSPSVYGDALAVSLAPLTPADVTPAYLSWLADEVVTRYTEARFGTHTPESARAYVEKVNASKTDRIWRIVHDGRHVGNIKLSGIDTQHRRASVAILIGDRTCWGRSVGPQAIEFAAAHAFGELGLHKLTAGIYAENTASIRAFEKAGFHIEATLREHRVLDGRLVDQVLMARFAQGRLPSSAR